MESLKTKRRKNNNGNVIYDPLPTEPKPQPHPVTLSESYTQF